MHVRHTIGEKDRQTETETERDRDRETETERERKTERQRDRDRETERERDRDRETETERDRDRETETGRQRERDFLQTSMIRQSSKGVVLLFTLLFRKKYKFLHTVKSSFFSSFSVSLLCVCLFVLLSFFIS